MVRTSQLFVRHDDAAPTGPRRGMMRVCRDDRGVAPTGLPPDRTAQRAFGYAERKLREVSSASSKVDDLYAEHGQRVDVRRPGGDPTQSRHLQRGAERGHRLKVAGGAPMKPSCTVEIGDPAAWCGCGAKLRRAQSEHGLGRVLGTATWCHASERALERVGRTAADLPGARPRWRRPPDLPNSIFPIALALPDGIRHRQLLDCDE